jgi:uncharacterized protein YdcH (DUF465 family)
MGTEVERKQTSPGPRLEKLLDERDHLRIQINLAEEGHLKGEELADLRRQLVSLDYEILKHWEQPQS